MQKLSQNPAGERYENILCDFGDFLPRDIHTKEVHTHIIEKLRLSTFLDAAVFVNIDPRRETKSIGQAIRPRCFSRKVVGD